MLALPAHSIYSSQTQAGDQLVLCVAEEMERRLERISEQIRSGAVAIEESEEVQSAVLLREQPFWSGGPGCWNWGRDRSKIKASPRRHMRWT